MQSAAVKKIVNNEMASCVLNLFHMNTWKFSERQMDDCFDEKERFLQLYTTIYKNFNVFFKF